MKKKFTNKMTNAIEPAASKSVWGYSGVPGKGGKTCNSYITEKKTEKENG